MKPGVGLTNEAAVEVSVSSTPNRESLDTMTKKEEEREPST